MQATTIFEIVAAFAPVRVEARPLATPVSLWSLSVSLSPLGRRCPESARYFSSDFS